MPRSGTVLRENHIIVYLSFKNWSTVSSFKLMHYPNSCILGGRRAIIYTWITIKFAMEIVSRIGYKILQGPSRLSIVHLGMQGSVCDNVRVARKCSLFCFNS